MVLHIYRYNVLGLSTTIEDAFFKCLDVSSVTISLMENVQSMEFRHIRQLVHSILIPLVKSCPPDMWQSWLEKLLYPLFIHSQQAITSSWSSLLHNGRARVPDTYNTFGGPDLKVEVMEEKLLRDFTREICALLATIASPGLNTGLPSLDQSGHIGRVDMSSLKGLDTFKSSSMVGYVENRAASFPCDLVNALICHFYSSIDFSIFHVSIPLQFPFESQRPGSPSVADVSGSFHMDRW